MNELTLAWRPSALFTCGLSLAQNTATAWKVTVGGGVGAGTPQLLFTMPVDRHCSARCDWLIISIPSFPSDVGVVLLLLSLESAKKQQVQVFA